MKHISDIYIIVLICCLLQGECKIYRLWEHMNKGEKCEGGEGIAHLIRVGVGTFKVNKKQIVTAEQSHLWRFNTLIHTNAHTHAGKLSLCHVKLFSACVQPIPSDKICPLLFPLPWNVRSFRLFRIFLLYAAHRTHTNKPGFHLHLNLQLTSPVWRFSVSDLNKTW